MGSVRLSRGLSILLGLAVLVAAGFAVAALSLGGPPPISGAPATERDIVYVIPDRYAGPATLRRYGFDNSQFLGTLRDRGFYVATRTFGNYQKTAHSMAASLGMRYLDGIGARADAPDDWGPVFDQVHGSRVATFLQRRGYEYVHVGSWWGPTAEDPAADRNVRFAIPPGLPIEEGLRVASLRQFEDIAAAAEHPGPQFVLAHILLPHPPYVFDRFGGPYTEREREGIPRDEQYLEQLRFTNVLLQNLMDRLLAGSEDEDPIVILQSDEGPHPLPYEYDRFWDWFGATDGQLLEKFRLLNAYYLPGVEAEDLSPTISPVNSFRVVLNEYFGQRLELLPDRSFVFRDEAHLYRFREVTARLAGAS
jgi:Sulfatase